MRRFSGMLCLVLIGGSIGCTTSSEVSQYEAALKQAATCDEVLEAIQEDAIAKVDLELKHFIDQDYYYRGGPEVFDAVAEGGAGGAGGTPPTQADGDNGAADPSGFSDTNRQVADVDEADIVKVGDEGWKLYVIRGNGFYEFDSWPASQTSKVADLVINPDDEGGGHAMEMFVEGDRAVVFSTAYNVQALDDGDLCQGYGYGVPELADIDGAYYCGRSFVKITVIDINGLSSDPPRIAREIYVDGWYTSSRRHDTMVRAVVQSNMQRPGTVPNLYEILYNGETYPQSREEEILLARMWAALAKEAILETTLEDWVPVWGERIDGEIQQQPVQCADFYSPEPGLTNYGLTQIVGIDMASDSSAQITSILGQVSLVYSNREVMVLTQPDWSYFERGINTNRTAVHRLSFEQQRTLYEGSGFVQGVVHDQFSIDEKDGIIRIATKREIWPALSDDPLAPDVWIPPTRDNIVSTMQLKGEILEVIGSTPGLAKDEEIRSARFLGDMGYIVTFRQIDPLFVIDLSDPKNPTVLGELKIPGFSTYIHPLEDDHLLTIGREVDEITLRDLGTVLQIFDVSDPVDPKLAHKAFVGDGFSEANHQHKAFNFYADKGLLAFPFVSYEGDFSSTLELWDVSVDTGFKYRGAVNHSDLVDCGGGMPFPVEEFYYHCGYQPQITRGVFIDNFIYSISHGGVRVHNVDDLTTPVATALY